MNDGFYYLCAIIHRNNIVMDRLFATHIRLLSETKSRFKRYLYSQINWDNRLIMIKGPKGVGKTTLLLQHIKESFKQPQKALYASVDHIWFSTNNLIDLADHHQAHGGTHLFLDEIHKFKDWDRQLKNIYDSYPQLHVVVTGSNMLELEKLPADMSRRCRQYVMNGLSFREYLLLEGVADLSVLSLNQLLNEHGILAGSITSQIKPLQYFDKYLNHGYYPFYKEEGDGFSDRLQQVVATIIENEIPAVSGIEYESVYKAKQLLGVLAERAPYTLNISDLTATLSVSRNTLLKLLDLMDKAAVIRRMFSSKTGMKMLAKPEKILFDNTNLMASLTLQADAGTLRETYFASQLALNHELCMPQQGDFLVDDTLLFEVGGKNKKFTQIKDIPNSYVVANDLEIGYGNKIPLWMFGLLY